MAESSSLAQIESAICRQYVRNRPRIGIVGGRGRFGRSTWFLDRLGVIAMARLPASDRELFWRRLIDRHVSSRLTVGELCRQAGVSTASFYTWRQRLQAASSAGSSLVPVRISTESSGRGERDGEIAVELTIQLADDSVQAVRVSIPPGCDEASIRRVLRAILSAGNQAVATCGELSSC